MTGAADFALIVRFAGDVDERVRADFLGSLREARLSAAAGWDLGDRGPQDRGPDVLALVTLMADMTEVGAAAISGLGLAVSKWLRAASRPGDAAYVELTDQPSQRVWRLSATDTELAHRLLSQDEADPASDSPLAWNGLTWSEQAPDPARPTAFVSYAHDSDQHKADVLALCEILARNGVEPRLDRWYLDSRRDWQLWATRQILTADYVLVIASQRCRQVGDGTNKPKTSLGLQSEMRILRELYHSDNQEWTGRILPVILPGHDADEIPIFLQPRTADHFSLPDLTSAGAENLLRILHRRAPYFPPAPGLAPDLPP